MIKINLLPEAARKVKKKRRKGPSSFVLLFSVITVTTLLIVGGATLYVKSEVSKLQAQSESNKAIVASLAKKISEVKKYEQINKELEQRSKLIETLRKSQSIPVWILDHISSVVPEGVWLNSVSYIGEGVSLEGVAFTNQDVVSYVENLKRSANITDVYLEETRESEVDRVKVYRFKLNFKVKT